MLTSRERVRMTLDHREPDRVPVDLGGFRASSIAAIAYNKLKQHLGIRSGDVYVYDFIQQVAVVEPEIRDYFDLDLIDLGRAFLRQPGEWQDWTLSDGTPAKIPAYFHPVKLGRDWHVYHDDGTLIAMKKNGCEYFEQTCWPRAGSSDDNFDSIARDINKIMWVALDVPPHPIQYGDEQALARLSATAKALRESTDKAIVGFFGGNLHDLGMMTFGMAQWFTMMAAEPARCHRFLDKILEMHMVNLPKYLAAVGPYVDIVLFADDLGTQKGPMFSPRMYREYFLPRHQVMWQTTKKLADVKVAIHCCGGVYSLLPGLIEAGLDIFNPVQTTARDMEPERLKREFGRDLCFWGGGCNTRDVLPQGTPAEVAEDVRRRVDVFAPGGGFIFNQIHNIMPEVPPANVVAMLQAVNARPSSEPLQELTS